jgi:hypothetical protein
MTRNPTANFFLATLFLALGFPFFLVGAGLRLMEMGVLDGYNWMDDLLP